MVLNSGIQEQKVQSKKPSTKKGVSTKVRDIRRVLMHVLCGSGMLKISSPGFPTLLRIVTGFPTFKDDMKKILQPIELESVNNNSFRRLFWPHGTHHSLQRILNSPVEAKPKSSYKAENPLMMQRLMTYCEV